MQAIVIIKSEHQNLITVLYSLEVLKALSAYEFSGDNELSEFCEAVLKYTQSEHEHVIIEEPD